MQRFLRRLFFRFIFPHLPVQWKWGYAIGAGNWQCFFAFNLEHAMRRAQKMTGKQNPFVARYDCMLF